MQSERDDAITRRELIQRSGIAAGALLLPEIARAGNPSAEEAMLPSGVTADWEIKRAYSEKTATRERVCLNGLWRWQPAASAAETPPSARWGHFKVPGSWPGITDYMQKDCQTVFPHPDWMKEPPGALTSAWYEREITVPADWTGRRISISAEYLNSLATVYLDGRKVGEMRFPAGDVDITPACRPGSTHRVSMLVEAAPLKAVMLSYTDTAGARQVKGTVERRGLCGDAYLASVPMKARIAEVDIDTSVQKAEITLAATLQGLEAGASYLLHARIREKDRVVREFTSPAFHNADLRDGRMTFSDNWKPEKLWDLHTPANMYTAQVELLKAGGKPEDELPPIRFGFRELWIKGRDFYLNGSRLYLAVVPFDNAQVGAAWSTYEGARETMQRMKTFGINFVYTHNYSCEPGTHLSFGEILRAADDEGMLVALSQPHFSHYDWKAPDADAHNGYTTHADFYARVARNHPSVVAYAMSHNATSSIEDINPDLIDGLKDLRESWGHNNAVLALRAEAIVKRFDPNRICYHHSSGNLGSMFTSNFYVNFTPIQELSDWFEHWATVGVKPAYLCEYGVPFSWDWTMYRGWYKGVREWGSAAVPWEFCLAEWDAQFFGDKAYQISEKEKANLRWEAEQFRHRTEWHRWDYPTSVGSGALDERNPVFADYITDNWRAYRTWGLSAFSPWEHAMYWVMRPGLDRKRKQLPVNWERLQRPGFSPDYLDDQPDEMVLAYERTDWVPTAAADAVIRNNRALLAYIAGKPAQFTSKDHNFLPGETIEKQLVLINNSRVTVTCDCSWSFETTPIGAAGAVSIPTGQQVRVPLHFPLPGTMPPGRYQLSATAHFSSGETQTDTFAIDVQPPVPRATSASAKIALFDPIGETAKHLTSAGVKFQVVDAAADLTGYELLVIGKGTLTTDGAGPGIRAVRDGLKVVVFEQTGDVLEKQFGFRVAEYGLRQAFRRSSDHPLLAGLDEESLRDWRGEATILPSRLKYTIGPRYAPTVKWCDIDVTRVWRCGCRGNVASALIEKPSCGDFLPIIDGGYGLQYSALVQYREGKGMVLFCQMDVTGRTESDPAAERLTKNIMEYAAGWKPSAHRPVFYAGEPEGHTHLEKAGVKATLLAAGELPPDALLILGPGAGEALKGHEPYTRGWYRGRGHVLAIGLDEITATTLTAAPVRMKDGEHIAGYFDRPAANSWRAGVAPADVHNRDPRTIPLVTAGPEIAADGVIAGTTNGQIIFCQLVPWHFDWTKQMNLKRTFRHVAFLTARLAANCGAASTTPLLDRFAKPAGAADKRWLTGLYHDVPEEWDDPYRFFGW